MDKILIIYTYACRENAIEVCDNSEKGVFLLEADYPFGCMSKKNMMIASYDTFIGQNDYDAADEWIKNYWDKSLTDDEGLDLSEWDGVNLKSGIHGLLIHPIYKTIRELIVAQKVFDLLSPVCVYCGEGVSVNFQIWKSLSEKRKIPFRELTTSPEKEIIHPFVDVHSSFKSHNRNLFDLTARNATKLLGFALRVLNQKVNNLLAVRHNKSNPISLFISTRPEKEMLRLGLDENELAKNGVNVVAPSEKSICVPQSTSFGETHLEAKEKFAHRWANLDERAHEHSWIYYNGICLWDFLREEYEKIFEYEFPRLAIESSISKATLQEIKPLCVISKISYHGDSLIWFEIAKNEKIPTILMQREQLIPGVNEGYPRLHADWVLTQGPSSDTFINNNCDGENTRTVQYGCWTRSELQSHEQKHEEGKIREKYGLSESQIVLYADGHYCGTSLRENPLRLINGLKTMFNCASKLPHLQFLVKIHPGGKKNHNEQRDYINRRLDVGGGKIPRNLVWLPVDSNLEEIFSLSPIVVSVYSTVGIEAMHMNLPSIFIYPKEHGNELPDFEKPIPSAIVAHCDDELVAIIKNISNDFTGWQNWLLPGQEKYWKNIFADYRSPASLIAKMIKLS